MTDLLWVLIGLAIILDLLCAAVRASVLNARLSILMNLAPTQPAPVRRTMDLLEKPRLRTSLRLAVVLMHFILAALAVWLTLRFFPKFWEGSPWVAVLVGVLGALVISILEHILEGRILKNCEYWALRFTNLAAGIDLVLSPLSAPLMRLLGSRSAGSQFLASDTEYELRNWVEEGRETGGLDQGEREMIYSIFQFGDRLAREIMVPRIDVKGIDIQSSAAEAARLLSASGHSRIPVYEDTIDNIIGLLYAKDLLANAVASPLSAVGKNLGDMREILREVFFVPEAKKVDELLQEMQQRRVHMAIVVDEYGGVAGLVTLEDIVEEIVGEIQDEFDQAEETPYTRLEDGSVSFRGSIDLDDFNEVMGSHIDKDYADTLGGLMFTLFGRVPANGEMLEVDGLILTVEQVAGRRIRQVRVRRDPETLPKAEEEEPVRRGLFGRRQEEPEEEGDAGETTAE